MKYNNSNKGFTLIELIIVLGIMGVVITAIFSFFLTNIKTFNRADDQVEVQYNAQVAMNEMVDNIMGAEEIEEIMPKDTIYNGTPIDVTNIKFKINDTKSIPFNYNSDPDKKTLYRISKTNPYAHYIEEFKIKFIGLPDEALNKKIEDLIKEDLIKKIKGIEITITSKKNDSTVTLKNKVYFRNAK